MSQWYFDYACCFVKILGAFFFACNIGKEMIGVSRSQKER